MTINTVARAIVVVFVGYLSVLCSGDSEFLLEIHVDRSRSSYNYSFVVCMNIGYITLLSSSNHGDGLTFEEAGTDCHYHASHGTLASITSHEVQQVVIEKGKKFCS